MRKLLLLMVCMLTALAVAQAPDPGKPIDKSQTLQFPLLNPPQRVIGGNAQRSSGNPGPRTLYYWVVTNATIGSSTPAGPFMVSAAPNVLDASDTIQISWIPDSSGVSYDVLRTDTPAPPYGICNCAVAMGVTAGSVTDNSESLLPYTVSPLDPAAYLMTLANEGTSAGISQLIVRQHGLLLGAINPFNSAAPPPLGTTTPNAGHFTDLSGNTLAISGPSAFGDRVTFPDIVQGSNITAFGDSYTACYGIVVPANCWINRFVTAKKWSLNNLAVSGTEITDSPQIDTMFQQVVTQGSISAHLCCVNDMRNSGAGGIVDNDGEAAWASAVEAGWLWLLTPDSTKIKASDTTAVTYSGAWTTPSQSYGGLMRQTVVPGSTASFTIYGSSVYIVTLWQVTGTATQTITVNGVTYPAVTTGTGAYASLGYTDGSGFHAGRQFGPRVFHVGGLTQLTNSVVVTCVTADVNNPCYFIFAAGGSGIATPTGPYLYAGNTLRFTAAGYASYGGSDLRVGEFNQRLSQVAEDLAADGFNIILGDPNAYYTPNATNTQADGVHPTDIGAGLVSQAMVYASIGYLTPNDRGLLRALQNTQLCLGFGAIGAGACPPGLTRGDGTFSQFSNQGAVYLGYDGVHAIIRRGNNFQIGGNGISLIQFGGLGSTFPALKMAGAPPSITVRAADDSSDADLGAKNLILSGGINNAVGKQHWKQAMCTTAATAGAYCDTATSFPISEPDTSYFLVCTLDATGSNGNAALTFFNATTTGATLRVTAIPATAQTGTANCILER